MRASRRRARQQGFTLVELLVTLAVTIIGLLGIMQLYVVTSRSNANAAQSGEAVAVAQSALEEVRAKTLPDLLTQYGATGLPLEVSMNTVSGRAGTTFQRRLFVTELTATSTNLIRIRVEIGWTDAGATTGVSGGIYDHRISYELIRTASEVL